MRRILIIMLVLVAITMTVHAQDSDVSEYEDDQVSFKYPSDLSVSFDKGIYYVNSLEFIYDPTVYEFGIFIYMLNYPSFLYPSLQISSDWEYGYIVGVLSFRQQFFSMFSNNPSPEYSLVEYDSYIDILGDFADTRISPLDNGVYGVVEAYPGELDDWVETYEIIFSSFELKQPTD